LQITDELSPIPGELGGFDYKIPLALLLSWLVVFLCLCKGVKSSGKVVYFTATFPYLILIALLINGVMLPGADKGLYYLFVPKWEKLLTITVWRKAAEQMFFSLGISWGGLIMFGSYNKFHNKIHIDASLVSTLDFLTSIIASVVIFSVLGFMAEKLNVSVEHVAEGGQGLAFVAYPEALSQLPLAWLWAVLFFFMLFLLGLDSEFALLETALTAMYDGFPKVRKYKVPITAASCIACFLLGLPCASSSGQYILDLMDTYGAGFAVLWIGIWELIGLMWIYGFKNVSKDIALMIGHEPCWFWKLCWGLISPIVLVVIFIIAVVGWEDPMYSQVIPYPFWAHIVGWVLVGISAIQIPFWAIVMTIYHAAKGRMSQVIKPTHKWGPGDPAVRREILDQQSGIQRNGKHAYDNQAMGYDGYHM
jgi:solute carrier family 6 amino acid transporter-like protein 5/7/9/14